VLAGGAPLLSSVFETPVSGIFVAMLSVLGFVLLRLLLRRTSFTVPAFIVLLLAVQAEQIVGSGTPIWIALTFQLVIVGIITLVVVRYGLLVAAIASAIGSVLDSVPLTLSLSHWTATTSNIAIALVIGLTLFGFYASRAGQPLLGNLEVKTEK